jgi:hypothetical protein
LLVSTLGALPAVAHDFFPLDGAAPGQPGRLGSAPGAVATTDTLPSAGGVKRDTAPFNALVYQIENLTGTHIAGGKTQFALFADAYARQGTALQARVSYDFDGNGTADRVETYRYFAVNNVANWERYTEVIRDGLQSATGTFADFRGGKIKLEVWSALGNFPIDLRVGTPSGQASQSLLSVPFVFSTAATPPVPAPTPAPAPTPPPAPTPTPAPVATTPPATGTGSSSVTPGVVASNLLYLRGGAVEAAAGALSTSPGSAAVADLVPSAGGQKHDVQPTRPLTYRLTGITASYVPGGVTQFRLQVDAGNVAQTAVQVRVSYDFTGDGTWDRVDQYHYYAVNDVVGWEDFAHDSRDGLDFSVGAFSSLADGTVQIEVWSALGNAPVQLRAGASLAEGRVSTLTIPFSFGAVAGGTGGTGTGGTGSTGTGSTGTGDTGTTGNGGSPAGSGGSATGGGTFAPPLGSTVPERFRTLIGNLGEGTGSSSHPSTITFPPSVLAPAGDPAYGPGYNPAAPLAPEQVNAQLAQGLAAWRRPGNHGSCVSCHAPDAFDLALIAYPDATIHRRALDHVDAADATRIVDLVKVIRQLYAIERPLDPLKFRPLQPGGELLPGTTPEQRDAAFGNLLANDVQLLWASGRIASRADALVAQAQLRDLDLRKLPIGVPFDLWSEDASNGPGHRSVSEWLPGMGVRPKAGRAAEWYALHDDYLMLPSDAKFWAYYTRIDDLLESIEPAGHDLGFQWSLLKYKSVQIAQHMLRHRSLAFPNPLVGRTGDAVANRRVILDRNPLFRTGDHLRRFPLFDDPAKPVTTFPAFLAPTLPTAPDELRRQTEQFFRAWFWMGWTYDPALLFSDEIFQTVEGDYLYASLLADYKLHHAFVVAKTSVAKAGATAWFNAPGPGVAGHGKWAGFTPFMVLHHIERNRNEPGAGDPRRAAHDRMFSNTARMWIYLVQDDLERSGTVYDRNLVRGAIRFARAWLDATEPGVDHAPIDAVVAQIETQLNQARELRTDFTTEDLSNALPF